MLTGTISTRLGDLVELEDLRLGENSFTGTLPPQIARLMKLGRSTCTEHRIFLSLGLYWVRHQLTLFYSVCRYAPEILLVNDTNLEGVIRDSFGSFEKLRFVDFSRNAFSGPLPGSIFDNGAIELVYLSENMFTGAIPSNLGNADTLRDLYVNDNKLVDMVPPIKAGELENLSEFRLENNGITGTMPSTICALRGDDRDDDLATLIADCGGNAPLIQCDCCNGCVDNSNNNNSTN